MRNQVRWNVRARTYHNIRDLTRWRTVMKLNRFEVLTRFDIQKSAGHVSLLLLIYTKCASRVQVERVMKKKKIPIYIYVLGETLSFSVFRIASTYSIILYWIGTIINYTLFINRYFSKRNIILDAVWRIVILLCGGFSIFMPVAPIQPVLRERQQSN